METYVSAGAAVDPSSALLEKHAEELRQERLDRHERKQNQFLEQSWAEFRKANPDVSDRDRDWMLGLSRKEEIEIPLLNPKPIDNTIHTKWRDYYLKKKRQQFAAEDDLSRLDYLDFGGMSSSLDMDDQRAKTFFKNMVEGASLGLYRDNGNVYRDFANQEFSKLAGAGQFVGELLNFISLSKALGPAKIPETFLRVARGSEAAATVARVAGTPAYTIDQAANFFRGAKAIADTAAAMPKAEALLRAGADTAFTSTIMGLQGMGKEYARQLHDEDKLPYSSWWKSVPKPLQILLEGMSGAATGAAIHVSNVPKSWGVRIPANALFGAAQQSYQTIFNNQPWDNEAFLFNMLLATMIGESTRYFSLGSKPVFQNARQKAIYESVYDQTRGQKFSQPMVAQIARLAEAQDNIHLDLQGRPLAPAELKQVVDATTARFADNFQVLRKFPTEKKSTVEDIDVVGRDVNRQSDASYDEAAKRLNWTRKDLAEAKAQNILESPELFLKFHEDRGLTIKEREQPANVREKINSLPEMTEEDFYNNLYNQKTVIRGAGGRLLRLNDIFVPLERAERHTEAVNDAEAVVGYRELSPEEQLKAVKNRRDALQEIGDQISKVKDDDAREILQRAAAIVAEKPDTAMLSVEKPAAYSQGIIGKVRQAYFKKKSREVSDVIKTPSGEEVSRTDLQSYNEWRRKVSENDFGTGFNLLNQVLQKDPSLSRAVTAYLLDRLHGYSQRDIVTHFERLGITNLKGKKINQEWISRNLSVVEQKLAEAAFGEPAAPKTAAGRTKEELAKIREEALAKAPKLNRVSGLESDVSGPYIEKVIAENGAMAIDAGGIYRHIADAYGRSAGDRVLGRLASIMQDVVQEANAKIERGKVLLRHPEAEPTRFYLVNDGLKPFEFNVQAKFIQDVVNANVDDKVAPHRRFQITLKETDKFVYVIQDFKGLTFSFAKDIGRIGEYSDAVTLAKYVDEYYGGGKESMFERSFLDLTKPELRGALDRLKAEAPDLLGKTRAETFEYLRQNPRALIEAVNEVSGGLTEAPPAQPWHQQEMAAGEKKKPLFTTDDVELEQKFYRESNIPEGAFRIATEKASAAAEAMMAADFNAAPTESVGVVNKFKAWGPVVGIRKLFSSGRQLGFEKLTTVEKKIREEEGRRMAALFYNIGDADYYRHDQVITPLLNSFWQPLYQSTKSVLGQNKGGNAVFTFGRGVMLDAYQHEANLLIDKRTLRPTAGIAGKIEHEPIKMNNGFDIKDVLAEIENPYKINAETWLRLRGALDRKGMSSDPLLASKLAVQHLKIPAEAYLQFMADAEKNYFKVLREEYFGKEHPRAQNPDDLKYLKANQQGELIKRLEPWAGGEFFDKIDWNDPKSKNSIAEIISNIPDTVTSLEGGVRKEVSMTDAKHRWALINKSYWDLNLDNLSYIMQRVVKDVRNQKAMTSDIQRAVEGETIRGRKQVSPFMDEVTGRVYATIEELALAGYKVEIDAYPLMAETLNYCKRANFHKRLADVWKENFFVNFRSAITRFEQSKDIRDLFLFVNNHCRQYFYLPTDKEFKIIKAKAKALQDEPPSSPERTQRISEMLLAYGDKLSAMQDVRNFWLGEYFKRAAPPEGMTQDFFVKNCLIRVREILQQDGDVFLPAHSESWNEMDKAEKQIEHKRGKDKPSFVQRVAGLGHLEPAITTSVPRCNLSPINLPNYEGLFFHRVWQKAFRQYVFMDTTTKKSDYAVIRALDKIVTGLDNAGTYVLLENPIALSSLNAWQALRANPKYPGYMSWALQAKGRKDVAGSPQGREYWLASRNDLLNRNRATMQMVSDSAIAWLEMLEKPPFSNHFKDIWNEDIGGNAATNLIRKTSKSIHYGFDKPFKQSGWEADEVFRLAAWKPTFERFKSLGDSEADAARKAADWVNLFMVHSSDQPFATTRLLKKGIMFAVYRLWNYKMELESILMPLRTLMGKKPQWEGRFRVSDGAYKQALFEAGAALRSFAVKNAMRGMAAMAGYGVANPWEWLTGYRMSREEKNENWLDQTIKTFAMSGSFFDVEKLISRDLKHTLIYNMAALPGLMTAIYMNRQPMTGERMWTADPKLEPKKVAAQLGMSLLWQYFPWAGELRNLSKDDKTLMENIMSFSGIGNFYSTQTPRALSQKLHEALYTAGNIEDERKAVKEFRRGMERSYTVLFNKKYHDISQVMADAVEQYRLRDLQK